MRKIIGLVTFLTLSLAAQVQAQDTASVTSFAKLSVTVRRSKTEIINLRLEKTGEFRCAHVWSHELPALATIFSQTPAAKPATWTKETQTLFSGSFAPADMATLTEAFQKLDLEKTANLDLDRGPEQYQDLPTYVVIVAKFVDGKVFGFVGEYKKYGKNTDKIDPFVKTILEFTERLK